MIKTHTLLLAAAAQLGQVGEPVADPLQEGPGHCASALAEQDAE